MRQPPNRPGRVIPRAGLLCSVGLLAWLPLADAASVESASQGQEAAQRGALLYGPACSFCHGVDAGGGLAPNLAQSTLVHSDLSGQALGAYLKVGRVATGMPAFPSLSDAEVSDLAAYLRRQATAAPPPIDQASILTGDARAGATYFNGAGRCVNCHTGALDLKGISARYTPQVIQGRMFNPRAVSVGRGRPLPPVPPAMVKVTDSGRSLWGTLVSATDFEVVLVDASGDRHSIPRDNDEPTVEIFDPLEAHRQHMRQWTDKLLHDVTAYLVSLK